MPPLRGAGAGTAEEILAFGGLAQCPGFWSRLGKVHQQRDLTLKERQMGGTWDQEKDFAWLVMSLPPSIRTGELYRLK